MIGWLICIVLLIVNHVTWTKRFVTWKDCCKSNFMFFVKFSQWFSCLSVIPLHFFGEIHQMRMKLLQTVRTVFLLFCCFWCYNNFNHFHQTVHPVILIFWWIFFSKHQLLSFFKLSQCLITLKWANAILLSSSQPKNWDKILYHSILFMFSVSEQASFRLWYDILFSHSKRFGKR